MEQDILSRLRKLPGKIGFYYKNLATGEVTPTGLPASNVLYFEMENNTWICVRPSGTEPKIKLYYGVVGTSLEDADAKAKAMADSVNDMINAF